MKKTVVTSFLTLFACTTIAAQQIQLRGTLKDATTKEPIAFAIIKQSGSFTQTQTDFAGNFVWEIKSDSTEKTICLIPLVMGYRRDTLCFDKVNTLDIFLEREAYMKEEVLITATRANEKSGMAYSEIGRADIAKQNTGRDIPFLLNTMPSVVTTSDAGNGVGYTGITIRGTDATRINVSINGIPLNDAESQGVFWVNMPDFVSSTDNIQVQRGVGTSVNGAGSFGGTINLQTDQINNRAYGEIIVSAGSFNTWRTTAKAGTGLINNRFAFDLRLSRLNSDGFIDRASSDLRSWYASGVYVTEKSLLRFTAFSGRERTYQAWYGVPEDSIKAGNVTFNPAGIYFDENGQLQYYQGETDNYQQDHYQLQFIHRINNRWNFNAALHATKGRGYYEQFKEDANLEAYGFTDSLSLATPTDLIRQLWLDNWYYGGTWNVTYNSAKKIKITMGGAASTYSGDHYGTIVWSRYLPPAALINPEFYFNTATKSEANMYGKMNYQLNNKFNLFIDGQYRYVNYAFEGINILGESLPQEVTMHFFNPKAGLTYEINDAQQTYASFSVGNKEPNRNDFTDSPPENRPVHETVYDTELGWRYRKNKLFAGVNLYNMQYKNQLILTGKINDVGAYTRQNVPVSFRRGIEVEGGYQPFTSLSIVGNLTYSNNFIPRFVEYIDNYDTSTQDSIVYNNAPIALSPNIISAVTITYNYKKVIETGFIVKHVGRQFLDNTGQESRSIDPYTILDYRFTWHIPTKSMQNLSVSAFVYNVLDLRYNANGYTYGWIAGGAEERYNFFYPQAGRNFMIMLNAKF